MVHPVKNFVKINKKKNQAGKRCKNTKPCGKADSAGKFYKKILCENFFSLSPAKCDSAEAEEGKSGKESSPW